MYSWAEMPFSPFFASIAFMARQMASVDTHTYGLGVRCPRPGGVFHDWGWSGAAGAFFAILPEEEVSFIYIQHVLASPIKKLRKNVREAVLQDIKD